MATNVIISSVDAAQKKYQKSITDISPTASDADIKAFAEAVNGLTTNTVTGIRKVETTDILNGEESTLLPRNMTIDQSTISCATIGKDTVANATFLTLSGVVDRTKLQVIWNETSVDGMLFITVGDGGNDDTFVVLLSETTAPWTGTVILTMPADDTYQEETVTITITE